MHAGGQQGRNWELLSRELGRLQACPAVVYLNTPDDLEFTTLQRSPASAFTFYALKMRTEHLPLVLPFLSSLS